MKVKRPELTFLKKIFFVDLIKGGSNPLAVAKVIFPGFRRRV
jgi:hypothetical protein